MSSANQGRVSSTIGNMPFMKRVADKNAGVRNRRKQQEVEVYKKEWTVQAGVGVAKDSNSPSDDKLIFVSNKKSMYLTGRKSFRGYNKHVEKYNRYLEGKPPLPEEDSDQDDNSLVEETFVKRKNKEPSPRKKKKRKRDKSTVQ